MNQDRQLQITGVPGFPRITSPCDLCELVIDTLNRSETSPETGDILLLAQKVVSKAEGRMVDLESVAVSSEAQALAERIGKPPELVEVILRESNRVEMAVRPHLITEHRLGWVCANAGIDQSNVDGGDRLVCLLPEEPDHSASLLREAVRDSFGAEVGVIITDTHGRPFRNGAIGLCIGCAGINPLKTYVGDSDLFGRRMRSSSQAVGDELASAASLIMGQGSEGYPLVLIRGYTFMPEAGEAQSLVRSRERDLFRHSRDPSEG